VPQDATAKNIFLHNATSTLAWLAFFLALLVLFLGNDILQEVVTIYPEWGLPAFFIPWFLLLILSVQKLRNNSQKSSLQIWILKTTIPVFAFTLPFFSKFLTSSSAQLGFEPYCLFVAIIILFVLHFLPSLNTQQ